MSALPPILLKAESRGAPKIWRMANVGDQGCPESVRAPMVACAGIDVVRLTSAASETHRQSRVLQSFAKKDFFNTDAGDGGCDVRFVGQKEKSLNAGGR
jgi:hypothetical protein